MCSTICCVSCARLCPIYVIVICLPPLVRALGTQLRMVGNHLAEKLLILLMHVPGVTGVGQSLRPSGIPVVPHNATMPYRFLRTEKLCLNNLEPHNQVK